MTVGLCGALFEIHIIIHNTRESSKETEVRAHRERQEGANTTLSPCDNARAGAYNTTAMYRSCKRQINMLLEAGFTHRTKKKKGGGGGLAPVFLTSFTMWWKAPGKPKV